MCIEHLTIPSYPPMQLSTRAKELPILVMLLNAEVSFVLPPSFPLYSVSSNYILSDRPGPVNCNHGRYVNELNGA